MKPWLNRLFITAAILGSVVSSFAQGFNVDWKQTSPTYDHYMLAAFAPGSRVVIHRRISNALSYIIGPDTMGGPQWSYQVDGSVSTFLTTTDGLVYATINRPTFASVVALRANDGTVAWQFDYNTTGEENLSDLRVFGGNLLVSGFGPHVGLGSTGTLISLNRLTGAAIFTRGYKIGNSAYDGLTSLRANASHAFLVMRHRSDQTAGLLKLDPATGDVVASRADIGQCADYQVDSVGNVYVGSAPETGGNFLKFDATGTGNIPDPAFWITGSGAKQLLLSAGYIYGINHEKLTKYRLTNGSVVWTRALANPDDDTFEVIRADASGKIYAMTQKMYLAEVSSGIESYVGFWGLSFIDPADGNDIYHQDLAYSSRLGGAFAHSMVLNGAGEVLLAGTRGVRDGPHASGTTQGFVCLAYQAPVPAPDTYTCVQNEHFATSGNGVLKNDKFVNPIFSTVSLLDPPDLGVMVMGVGGEFTYNAPATAGTQTFTYEVTRGPFSATGVGTINIVRGLLSLSLARTTLAGQNATQGTVTVSSPGPASVVTIQDDSSLVTTPASVTIAAGQTTKTFAVQVLSVNSQINTHVLASYGGFTRTVALTLTPLVPSALAFMPSSSVTGGNSVSCRLVLNGVAGPGGRTVSIYDNSNFSTVPSSVVVPAGATEVTFTVSTTHPVTQQVSKITAAVTAGTASANLFIKP